jgi:hypothetical protein
MEADLSIIHRAHQIQSTLEGVADLSIMSLAPFEVEKLKTVQ